MRTSVGSGGGTAATSPLRWVSHSPQARKLQRQLLDLISGLVAEAAEAGVLRRDISADEMAGYCVHALSAAGDSVSPAAVDRLVDVVWDGMTSTNRDTSRHRAAGTPQRYWSPSRPKMINDHEPMIPSGEGQIAETRKRGAPL
jgi:Transcriptional regulator SbtR-like, C-terminal domain